MFVVLVFVPMFILTLPLLLLQSNNNRLAGYIDKVRALQTENKRLLQRRETVEEEQVSLKVEIRLLLLFAGEGGQECPVDVPEGKGRLEKSNRGDAEEI